MGNKRGQGRMGIVQGSGQDVDGAGPAVQTVLNQMLGNIFSELDEFAKQELEGKHGYGIFGLKNAIQTHVSSAFGAISQQARMQAPEAEKLAMEKEDNGQA